jgi:hypothetical protein
VKHFTVPHLQCFKILEFQETNDLAYFATVWVTRNKRFRIWTPGRSLHIERHVAKTRRREAVDVNGGGVNDVKNRHVDERRVVVDSVGQAGRHELRLQFGKRRRQVDFRNPSRRNVVGKSTGGVRI